MALDIQLAAKTVLFAFQYDNQYCAYGGVVYVSYAAPGRIILGNQLVTKTVLFTFPYVSLNLRANKMLKVNKSILAMRLGRMWP
jgi:hypothetical protein